MRITEPAVGLSTGRLEALSDGVLAIVMTLLVFGLTDDRDTIVEASKYGAALEGLAGLFPDMASFVISFLMIAGYWARHHHIFHYVESLDGKLILVNTLFLLSVSFIPFPTDLIAETYEHESCVLLCLYSASHVLTGGSLILLWWCVTRDDRRTGDWIAPETVHAVGRHLLTGPVVFLIALPFCLIDKSLVLALYITFPLIDLLVWRPLCRDSD